MRSAATGKRTHSGGDSGDSGGIHTDVQNDGFTEFKSRYTKRRCRRDAQQSDPSDQNQSGGEQTPQHSQPSRRGGSRNRGGSRGRVGHQSRGHVVGSSSVNNNNKPAKPAGKSVVSTDAIEAAIDSVISQSQSLQAPSQSQSTSGSHLHTLTAQVKALQKEVADLKHQVEFLLSIAGTNGPILVENTATNPSADGSQTYAAAASRQLSAPLREAVLSAVHSDLRVKQSRSCNIVVSGLPLHDEFNDDEFFTEFCICEFGFNPDIIRTVRLGNELPGRLQPLLVVLRSEDGAKDLLAMAKLLRQSEDSYTSRCVFIAPHQTRAERRRQQVSARQLNSPAERGRPQPRDVRSHRSADFPTGAASDARFNDYLSSTGWQRVSRPTTTSTDRRDIARAPGSTDNHNKSTAAEFNTESEDDEFMAVGDAAMCDSDMLHAPSSLRQSAVVFKPAAAASNAPAATSADVLTGASNASSAVAAAPGY